jgi:hypothetical protein
MLGICRIVRNDPAKILRQWNDKSDWVHTPPSLPRHFNASPKVLRTDDWNIITKITRGEKNLKEIGKIKWTRLDQKRGDAALCVEPSLYSVEGREGVHPLKTFIASLDLVYNRRRCFGMEESRGEWNLNANRSGWIERNADAERGASVGKYLPLECHPYRRPVIPRRVHNKTNNISFSIKQKKEKEGDIPPPSDTLLRTSSNDGMDEK